MGEALVRTREVFFERQMYDFGLRVADSSTLRGRFSGGDASQYNTGVADSVHSLSFLRAVLLECQSSRKPVTVQKWLQPRGSWTILVNAGHKRVQLDYVALLMSTGRASDAPRAQK